MKYQNTEHFVANNITEATWLRLKRLSSSQLCKKIIAKNHPKLNEDIIEQKSIGMSSAVRSAFGYWDTKEGGLNSKILSRYYALLQITIAEQISSNDPNANLKSVQKHTEYGHGLYTLKLDKDTFPDNMMIGCLNSGHFSSYIKSLNFNIKEYTDGRRPKNTQDLSNNAISLTDLLRRIPELQGVVNEYLGKAPLSYHFGHASLLNFSNNKERSNSNINYTFAAIYPHETSFSIEEFNTFDFEIKEVKKESSSDSFIGKVYHPKGELWWDSIESYKSDYCGTSIIAPFWGMKDIFVLHFIILYSFSIIVRYLPEVWYEIEHGKLDYIRALLEHYLVIVDNVLPKIAVERLTKVKLIVSQPGGMNAPI